MAFDSALLARAKTRKIDHPMIPRVMTMIASRMGR
jgi:hypothetical protein